MTGIIVALAIVLGTTFAATPAQTQNPVTGIGIGTESCGKWTQNKQARAIDWIVQGAWVFGYLTGAMAYGNPTGDPLGGTDAEGILGWVSNYCAAHPLSHVYEAANELARVLTIRAARPAGSPER
jgi:hypothetical protein